VVTVKSAHQHFRIIAGTALQKYKGWDILQWYTVYTHTHMDITNLSSEKK
jgi:hypothetical protein